MTSEFTVIPNSALDKIGFSSLLEETLRHTVTEYGREQVQQTVIEVEGEKIDHKLQMSADWQRCKALNPAPPIRPVGDIRPILQACSASGSMLPPEDFLTVAENARMARLTLSYFRPIEPEPVALGQYTRQLTSMKPLENEIARRIDENGSVRDDASTDLKKIRTRLRREESRLRSTLQRLMKRHRDAGRTSDEGITLRNGRMVIPVQAEFKRKIDGFVHDVSSSGQTVYIEPVEALPLHNAIRQLEAEEKREIEKILRELTGVIRQHQHLLLRHCALFGILDASHARTIVGENMSGLIPERTQNGTIRLNQARNPILYMKNGPEDVVPLQMTLDPEEQALIITGPNAGGKSVAMKTVGLLHLMFQSGYPVPAGPGSALQTLSGLFLDLGDEQSIESDLSTFSSRLRWMKETLESAQPNALILVDEAGAGTDPEEGGALFQAFIEEALCKSCRVLATTHHGSLKVFAHHHPNVINGAMEFNQASLSPTYRFIKGVPGSSYAFEIAGRLMLPPHLIHRARELIGEQRDAMGELLLDLEASLQETEKVRAEAALLKEKSQGQLQKVQAGMEETERKRQAILRRAYADADQILKNANRRIESAVEKIVSSGSSDAALVKEARKEIAQTKDVIRRKKAEMDVRTRKGMRAEDVSVGDVVSVGDDGLPGEVIYKRGGRVTILINGMKIKSDVSKIQPAKKAVKSKSGNKGMNESGQMSGIQKKGATAAGKHAYKVSNDVDLSASLSVDLRGLRGNDAVKQLTDYLDRAIATGLRSVAVIHGIGEGVLMKLVHKTLQERKEVDSFESAPPDQGGAGKTLVTFKE